MHNWLELYLLGRERVAETRRRASAPRAPRGAASAGATLILGKGEVLSLRLPRGPFRIGCIAGRLWATADRSEADHLLTPGEAATFRGRGTLVIQALRTSTTRIDCETAVPVVLSLPLRPAAQPG